MQQTSVPQQGGKLYDFEERSRLFADRVCKLVERLPRTIRNLKYGDQIVRSSGSVGANYVGLMTS